MSKVRVLVVDNFILVRQCLVALLKAESWIEVVGEAEDGCQAVTQVDALVPDVVLMEVVIPVIDGWDATRQILTKYPNVRVLVLSSYQDEDWIVQLLEAGASGYLTKHCRQDDLMLAIREVSQRRTFLGSTVSRRLIECYRREQLAGLVGLIQKKKLTSREREVLRLIALGKRSRQIALEFGVSSKTVDTYRQRIMAKLNIHETAGLTRYAFAKRIIEHPAPLLYNPSL